MIYKKWALLNKMGAVGKRSSSPLEKFAVNELNLHYASVATVHPLCSTVELAHILDIPLYLMILFLMSPISRMYKYSKQPLLPFQNVKVVV